MKNLINYSPEQCGTCSDIIGATSGMPFVATDRAAGANRCFGGTMNELRSQLSAHSSLKTAP
jgi:hypothetical protein